MTVGTTLWPIGWGFILGLSTGFVTRRVNYWFGGSLASVGFVKQTGCHQELQKYLDWNKDGQLNFTDAELAWHSLAENPYVTVGTWTSFGTGCLVGYFTSDF